MPNGDNPETSDSKSIFRKLDTIKDLIHAQDKDLALQKQTIRFHTAIFCVLGTGIGGLIWDAVSRHLAEAH